MPRLHPWALLVTLSLTLLACPRRQDEGGRPSAATPSPDQLEPLELRDETPSLLLTWVDAQGDFHVVQRIVDVPAEARGAVRVVQTTREAGTGDRVYVADLRQRRADGTYAVETRTRAGWEEVGAARRKARLEALAPSAAAPAASASAATPAGGLVVQVYGADWCKPCKDVERYLRQRGVRVEHRDIEADPLARAELERKLRASNLPPTAQIPIVDVRGRLLVGFSPSAIDSALKSAEEARTL
ncbi:MAG TPA: glutaredoxin domain-containing protein [Polyangiaceae bacterium]|nr:glutaredoxin domain-containing protein [Polyangiaceae bacterium]